MINKLEVGELVTAGIKEGVVIYSSPILNEQHVLFTVWYANDGTWTYYKNRKGVKKIKNPSKNLISFGKKTIKRIHEIEPANVDSLTYLRALDILKKYKRR